MNIEIFKKDNYEIRSIMVNNVPHFVAKDVAEALGYTDTVNAIKDHVREKHRTNVGSLGGGELPPLTNSNTLQPQTVVITEAGLY